MAVSETNSRLGHLAGRYLTFSLAGESFGIRVLSVQEIIRLTAITAVPQLPAHLRGVINLRGRIVPVVDMRRRFGLAAAADTGRTCIVVVQIAGRAGRLAPMGLIVDAVEEVLQIGEAELSPPPELGASAVLVSVLALARIKGQVKTLLDIQHVLTGEQFAEPAVLAAA